MKWKNWLENWDLTTLKIKAPFLEMEWNPNEPDRDAAWELYVELLTRITTQSLAAEDGDEKTALNSVYSLFPITRAIIKQHGRDSIAFTRLAVVVLNQIIRPFTARWHRASLQGEFNNPQTCQQFREELSELQKFLRKYTQMLADMAGVEDLTALEDE
jgi:hypothetical protein